MEESDMSFQIYNWLEKYVHEVVSTFGYRIWFIGVQGSYARGEATEESDIDVVLILHQQRPPHIVPPWGLIIINGPFDEK